ENVHCSQFIDLDAISKEETFEVLDDEPENFSVAFQDPPIAIAILRALPDIKKEMSALVFQ
ncbi:17215_t:CDS:2, partial [Cetraspora pellucida]